MKTKKLCLISSSGGHFEQLKKLKPLENNYEIIWITEKTRYASTANYYLKQTGLKDIWSPLKMLWNFFYSLIIWLKEKPDAVITTGTMVAIPISLICKLNKKKLIYIESFARVNTSSKTGALMYKIADLFIVQWVGLKEIYPKAIYGGSIY